MIRKKSGKKSGTAKKSAGKAKKSGKKSVRVKEMDMAKVRQDVANIIGSEATEIAVAVVGEAKKGQLTTAKYLFEVAGVYPKPAEGETSTEDDEESFAKILVERLKAAEDPKVPEDFGDEENVETGVVKKDSVVVV